MFEKGGCVIEFRQQAPQAAPQQVADSALQSHPPQPMPPKRTSSSSKSRPKKTVAQLKQEAHDSQHAQLHSPGQTFAQQPVVTPKPPPKRKPASKQQQLHSEADAAAYTMNQPQIIYQHSSTPSTSYGQPTSVSVQYTSNMKVPMSGEILSLPPGAISGLPFTPQPGQRIYVIQSSAKQDSFDSAALPQPITTSALPKAEAKPPPKRRRPPPKPKPPKFQSTGKHKIATFLLFR